MKKHHWNLSNNAQCCIYTCAIIARGLR